MPDLSSSLGALAGDLPSLSEAELTALWDRGNHRRRRRRAVRGVATVLLVAATTATPLSSIWTRDVPPQLITSVRSDAMLDCLRRHGFEGVRESYGTSFTIEEQGRYREFRAANEDCLRDPAVVAEMRVEVPLTRAEVEKDYLAQAEVARCLAEQGYRADVPSLEEFMEQRRPLMEAAGPQPVPQPVPDRVWIAYNVVGAVGQAEWTRLNSLCPQPQ